MKKIKWTKDGSVAGFLCYQAKIGFIYMSCTPQIEYFNYHTDYSKRRLIGWRCRIRFNGRSIGSEKMRKSLENAKSDAEKLAEKCLSGCGFEVVKGLKEVGMLEEVLSEVGIDL